MIDESQFKKIRTGNGYPNDLTATNTNRLEMAVIELQKLQENNTQQTKKLGALLGTLDDNIIALQEYVKILTTTIKEANAKNDRQQKWFILLTVIGTIFAVLSFIEVIDILIRGIGN